MGNFAEKLRTKGKVDEDRYFAKRDRELLKAMKNLKQEQLYVSAERKK